MREPQYIEIRSEAGNKLKDALADYFIEHDEVNYLKFHYPNGVTLEVKKYE